MRLSIVSAHGMRRSSALFSEIVSSLSGAVRRSSERKENGVLAMMMSGGGGARSFDLNENLFDDVDDDEAVKPRAPSSTSSKFPNKESPSEAMQALLADRERKTERRKAKPKTLAASQFGRARTEVEAMIESDDWSGATARHLVALYDVMHTEVYGVECAELGPAERYNATMMAANLTKREFSGDYTKAVEFMRWAWAREADSEKWRRENGRTHARRIGARLMFGGSLLTDYRVYLARTR